LAGPQCHERQPCMFDEWSDVTRRLLAADTASSCAVLTSAHGRMATFSQRDAELGTEGISHRAKACQERIAKES
jgi:hypothetical protein